MAQQDANKQPHGFKNHVEKIAIVGVSILFLFFQRQKVLGLIYLASPVHFNWLISLLLAWLLSWTC